MSTELIDRPELGYKLTGFYGGTARGYCLQLTFPQSVDCLQLTAEGARQLANDIIFRFLREANLKGEQQ